MKIDEIEIEKGKYYMDKTFCTFWTNCRYGANCRYALSARFEYYQSRKQSNPNDLPLFIVQEKPDCHVKSLSKNELEDGVWYKGSCRNAGYAFWIESKQLFVYKRTKFDYSFSETIKHPEDDDGFDVFVPHQKSDIEIEMPDVIKEYLEKIENE